MPKLPTISGKKFSWKGQQGIARQETLGLRGVPMSGFYIESQLTGRKLLFIYDEETMEANEFFDGEYVAFMSPGNGVSVQLQLGYA